MKVPSAVEAIITIRTQSWHTSYPTIRTGEVLAPNITSLDDLRRKVISDLVDLDLMVGRTPLTRRQRFTRGVRRRGATLARFGR